MSRMGFKHHAGIALAALAAVALGTPRALPGFVAPLSYQVGIRPIAVVVGDFNNDNQPDIVVVNQGFTAGSVSVLLGNGDGTFRRDRDYPVGVNASSLTVGDFNGDGQLDLAVTNHIDQSISILLGNGDGTFQPAVTFSVAPALPLSVAAADFDGDGKLDLALVGENAPLLVLLGNGDGTFQAPRSYAVGDMPISVAVGDFNGDGIPDLVCANQGSPSSFYSDASVSVLVGNGDGTFQPARTFATGPSTRSVAVADFNGDGKLDLVTANSDGTGTASVLLGNGDGTFQPGQDFATSAAPLFVAVADLNGDGKDDFITANPYGGSVSVFLGNGDGTFQPAHNYEVGPGPETVAVAVFRPDGKPDLVTANWQGDSVSIVRGRGDGTFVTPISTATGKFPSSVVAGDFNGDGKLDLAVANGADSAGGQPGSVTILLGQGDGSFQGAGNYLLGPGTVTVALGDFNGDGKLDVAATFSGTIGANRNPGGVSVLLGNGDGTFAAPVSYEVGRRPLAVAVADFNGDGVPDLVVANSSTSNVSLLLGNGDGTFGLARSVGTVSILDAHAPAVGDFNGDGLVDLAVATNTGVALLLGNGDGTFGSPVLYDVGGFSGFVTLADFNGDGKLDLAVTNSLDPIYQAPGRVSVLLGNGDGSFQPPQNYDTPQVPGSVVVADFNSDGVPDLAIATFSGVAVLVGNHDGSFRPAVTYAGGAGYLTVGDFNGDQAPDLVLSVGYMVWTLLNGKDWPP